MPTSWASFPPGHLGPGRGGLLSRVAACRWHGPAVGRACLSQAGPHFRVAAVWGLPASFRSHKARAACVWSAGPGRLWGQLALAMASVSTPLPQAPQLSPGRGRGWAGGATQARVGQGESRALTTSWPVPGVGGLSFGVYPPWGEDSPRGQQVDPAGLGISASRAGAGGHRQEVR